MTMQFDSLVLEKTNYYFTRAKDIHQENNELFVTLFARLTIENAYEAKSVWVEMEEVKWDHAHANLKAMPNGLHTYRISREIFHGLTDVADLCHNELYYLTPIHKAAKFKQFS